MASHPSSSPWDAYETSLFRNVVQDRGGNVVTPHRHTLLEGKKVSHLFKDLEPTLERTAVVIPSALRSPMGAG